MSEIEGPASPLQGITVVEFGQFVSVPFCGQMLADSGARVIKVEPIDGDAYRRTDLVAPGESRQFLTRNRGKESISLNLSSPASSEILRRLILLADVILINMSPDATKRRGLDYDSVSAINPRTIHGAISAYGSGGPESQLTGVDVVMQARSGLLSSLGASEYGVPRHSEVQISDYTSSVLLFGGIAMALFARERTGVGQAVRVSLLGAALTVQNQSLSHVYGVDEWRHDFVDNELPRLRSAGASMEKIEIRRRAMRPDPPVNTTYYRVFPTKDGAVAVGAASPVARERLFKLTDVTDELLATDPDQLHRRLLKFFGSLPSESAVAMLRAEGIPAEKVRHFEEMLFDPQVEAEGLVADIDHYAVGRYRALGVPIQLSGTPMRASTGSPPFAAHTRSILDELGYGDAEIDCLLTEDAVKASEERDLNR